MTARDLLASPPAGTDILVSAPGRANLMGDHTDGDEGYVLPVALDLRTVLAGRRVPDRLVVRSAERPDDGVVEVDLRSGAGPTSGWGRYATAVVAQCRAAGLRLHGFDGVLSSDVPIGAGLSSSAALEVAVALALLDDPPAPADLARLCQRAENEGVGVQSGILDQFASVACRAGAAMLLDCRDLAVQHVPLGDDLAVLVVHCGVGRDLSGSAYNERRDECARAASALGVRVLRDATAELLAERWSSMDDVVRRRARHVVTENARVLATAAALRTGDRAAVGELFAASHESLARDFEVSTPDLDLLVAAAAATDGVVGSRLTGAGFGGCTVSLVAAAGADETRDEVCRRYAESSGRTPRAWVSPAASGATAA